MNSFKEWVEKEYPLVNEEDEDVCRVCAVPIERKTFGAAICGTHFSLLYPRWRMEYDRQWRETIVLMAQQILLDARKDSAWWKNEHNIGRVSYFIGRVGYGTEGA